ncbi:hypothetical protein ACRAKI_21210 [Saccharothrix isguenensis]
MPSSTAWSTAPDGGVVRAEDPHLVGQQGAQVGPHRRVTGLAAPADQV